MTETSNEIIIQTGPLDGLPQYYSEHDGIALIVQPHTTGDPSSYDVVFYPIEDGKPDFNNSINSHIFDIGSLADVPEIADRYQTLFQSGISVKKIFEDLENKSE